MPSCNTNSQKLPPFGNKANTRDAMRHVADAVNSIIEGRTQNACSIELDASTTKTTYYRQYVGQQSTVFLQATNANAASEIASIYVSAVRNGEFDVTHPSNTSTRTFDIAWVG
jgi:hypothetical protein